LKNAGLPTWQLRKPNVLEDLRLTADGMVCLDLESVLPAVFVSWDEHRAALKEGKLFSIDFVNFKLLWKEARLAKSVGYDGIEDFTRCIIKLQQLSD
jgi:hypothetical protein